MQFYFTLNFKRLLVGSVCPIIKLRIRLWLKSCYLQIYRSLNENLEDIHSEGFLIVFRSFDHELSMINHYYNHK